jgi:hypothetical protein
MSHYIGQILKFTGVLAFSGGVQVYFLSPANRGQFQAVSRYGVPNVFQLVTADFPGDGELDLTVTNFDGTEASLTFVLMEILWRAIFSDREGCCGPQPPGC